MSTLVAVGLPGAALGIIGWVDYVTGPDLALFPFYLVALVVISLRFRCPAAMLYGVLASAIFLVVDLATEPRLLGTIAPYWRAAGQLLSFSLVTFTIPRLREERQRLVASQAALMGQRTELYELNARLVTALENLSAARQQTLEELVERHIAEVQGLLDVVDRRGLR